MREISVDPERLRRTAQVVDVTVQRAESETAVPASRNLGHAELGAAVGDFVQALTGGWTEVVAQSDDVASGLRDSAAMYEMADAKANATVKALKEGL